MKYNTNKKWTNEKNDIPKTTQIYALTDKNIKIAWGFNLK